MLVIFLFSMQTSASWINFEMKSGVKKKNCFEIPVEMFH